MLRLFFVMLINNFISCNDRWSRQRWLELILRERASQTRLLRVNLIQYPQHFCSARLKKFSLQKQMYLKFRGEFSIGSIRYGINTRFNKQIENDLHLIIHLVYHNSVPVTNTISAMLAMYRSERTDITFRDITFLVFR